MLPGTMGLEQNDSAGVHKETICSATNNALYMECN